MTHSTIVPATAPELETLRGALGAFWLENHLPPGDLMTFELVLEEVFINVVSYGVSQTPGTSVEMRLALNDGVVSLVCIDQGIAFNPLEKELPDVNAALEDRPIGGLGIFLVEELMDAVTYQRRDDKNELHMSKRLSTVQ
jgi:anti-sigma regulatory factor (Ser/Thr protein kinase)